MIITAKVPEIIVPVIEPIKLGVFTNPISHS